MGLLSLLVVTILIAVFFTYSYFSGLPKNFTPQDSQNIQSEAESAMDANIEKSRQQQTEANKLAE